MKLFQPSSLYKQAPLFIPTLSECFARICAVCITLLALPVYSLNILLSIFKFSSPFCKGTTSDLKGREYHYLEFNHGLLRHSLMILLITKGDMTWVGLPRDVKHHCNQAELASMKVGLVSLYGLHHSTGISNNQMLADTAKQEKYTQLERLLLVVRMMFVSVFFSTTNLKPESSFKLFGIQLDNTSLKDAVAKIVSPATNRCTKTVCFVNVNSFNLAHHNDRLCTAINASDYVFADGSGVRMAAQKKGYRLLGNVNGTDMLPVLCQQAVSKGQSIFLLGAEQGVAAQTALNLEHLHPGLRISGTHHGYFTRDDTAVVIEKINEAKTDILLVALGSPHQESWLQEHKSELQVNTAVAVGGLLDFYSGRISRAPVWLREIGMEWVWRLIQEPRNKFYRYVIGNPLFIFRIFFTDK